MINPSDFLPQPPWDGPPVPKSVWATMITYKRTQDIGRSLKDIIERIQTLQADLPRYIELIKPYAESWQIEAFNKCIGPYPNFKDVGDAYTATQIIEAKGIVER